MERSNGHADLGAESLRQIGRRTGCLMITLFSEG